MVLPDRDPNRQRSVRGAAPADWPKLGTDVCGSDAEAAEELVMGCSWLHEIEACLTAVSRSSSEIGNDGLDLGNS